jgi:hypothetical protein
MKNYFTSDVGNKLPDNKQNKDKDSNAQIGDFIVDIGLISKTNLVKMRRFLPQGDYRLLKNRICARICRKARKEKTISVME